MELNEMIETANEIADYFGIDEQSNQLKEECAELIQALSKLHRASGHGLPTPYTITQSIECVKEELSDVLVNMEQIMHLLKISDNDLLLIADYKLKRSKDRMRNML